MPGPGQHVSDPTAGITAPQELPPAKIVPQSRNFKQLPCPQCGKASYGNRTRTRILHDVSDLVTGHPRDIAPRYSQHRCRKCNKCFDADTSAYSLPKARYTHRVRTHKHTHNRIALDMLQDLQKDGRTDTLQTLHRDRTNPGVHALQGC